MAKPSAHEAFLAASPGPTDSPVEVVDDIDRILALPRRPPVDCRLDPVTRRYAPETQALINAMTKKFGRGPRVSCGCRPRVVRALPGNRLSITRVLPDDLPPEPPRVVAVQDFAADHQACGEEFATAQRVAALRPGEELSLPAADAADDPAGHFCIDTLNGVQAWGLYEIPREGAGLGFCGVGSGKSKLFLLLPMAFRDECRVAVLLIEPNQRKHYASQYRQTREHFWVPSIVFDDGQKPLVSPGAPTLHLLPYSKVGNPRHPDDLDDLNPTVVGADEGHRLTGKVNTTGRTRVKRFCYRKIEERAERIRQGLPVGRRAVYLVPMSGTLEDKSVEDTGPVSALSLGTNSPLPLTEAEAARWGPVFDPVRSNDRKTTTARRLQAAFGGGEWVDRDDVLSDILGEGPERAIREGFCKWRNWTPGVISASAEGVSASLYFKERKVPKMPECVAAALKKVRDEGIRPDGEPIVGDDENDAAAMVKIVAKQVARGLFYYWAYPGVPCACGGPGAEGARCEGCLLIDEWFARRKRYYKEERSRLLSPLPHLDSHKLACNAAQRALEDASAPTGVEVYCVACREEWPCGKKTHLPAWRSSQWKSWSEIADKVPHVQRTRWIGHDLPEAADPETHPGYYVARDTAKYALGEPGVVWYQTVAYGEKVAQLAKLPCHGGGPESEAAIRAETGKRSVIASLKAWGKGLDGLQHKFWRQLYPEFPSSNRIVEQSLGRLLRRGQRRDTVESEYYADVAEFREAIRKVKRRAEFNQAMRGEPALVLAADWDD